MSENNAHKSETREQRIKRFEEGHPIEIIESLLGSIQNFFNNEISATVIDPYNRQTTLLILGVHSVALTIANAFFGNDKEPGYKWFLETYVDGDTSDRVFSIIAPELHAWRNVLAHRWLNVAGHEFGYDYDIAEGWEKRGDIIFLNPAIYLKQYLRAFERRQGGMMYRYNEILNTDEKLEEAKRRIMTQYLR